MRNGEDSELIWRLVATNGLGVHLNQTIGARRHHGTGHLSINCTMQDRLRRGIGAYAAFADWLAEEGRTGQYLSKRRLGGIIGLGIRAGAIGDVRAKSLARKLPERLSPETPRINRLVSLGGAPNSRAYYVAVLGAYLAAKHLRNAGRSIARLAIRLARETGPAEPLAAERSLTVCRK